MKYDIAEVQYYGNKRRRFFRFDPFLIGSKVDDKNDIFYIRWFQTVGDYEVEIARQSHIKNQWMKVLRSKQ